MDLQGNAGKSLFVDIIERDPELKVMRLPLDYYRAFKYQSAKLISDYKNNHGVPDVIVIDAPRDEETKYLHEVYAALEEINNGRLEGSFMGKMIKDSIPRGIPMVVFSNSPPIMGALSSDRWETMALYGYTSSTEQDIFIQKATTSCNIVDVTSSQIYWKNYTFTYNAENIGDEWESDRLLMEMQVKNIKTSENLMKLEIENFGESKINPGRISADGPMQVSAHNKAPSYVLIKAREKLKFIKKNS